MVVESLPPTDAVFPDAPASVEVLAVTELDLDLGAPSSTAQVRETPAVEFVELPKAVYDRFFLEAGESLTINIAANDKIGGQLEAVRATALGELPPGFTLQSSGVLSGKSDDCGRWRQQYALVSDNPFVGTSWIDITVGGCVQTE